MSTTANVTSGGLSPSDVEGIREALAAGRKPKVMFTEAAGQIAGEVGQVVKLGDPAESDEWLVVRFGRDELPFSPTDLTMPPRGRTSKRTGAADGATPAADNATKEGAVAAKAAPPPARPAGQDQPAAPEQPAEPERPVKRTARKARPGKPKPPASLTITLAYDNGEWTVAAHQGSKVIAKPYVVRAAEALKMVGMLDVAGVHDAVEAIVSAELSEAAQRAEQLRNELAEVEARLAELRDAG